LRGKGNFHAVYGSVATASAGSPRRYWSGLNHFLADVQDKDG
jgi:hypothetical protein